MSPRFSLTLREIASLRSSGQLKGSPKMSAMGAYRFFNILYNQRCLSLLAGSLVIVLLIKTISHEHYIRDVTQQLVYAQQVYSAALEGDSDSRQLMMEFPVSRVRFDNKRLVQIYEHVRTGKAWNDLKEAYDICLSTQTSIERLYWVPQVLQHWSGPLSLAVLLVDETEWWIFNMFSNYLERCYPRYGSSVSVHVVLPDNASTEAFIPPMEKNKKVTHLLQESTEKTCGDFGEAKDYLQNLLIEFGLPTVSDKDKLATKIIYPQNHLRNVARKTCPTPWTYSVDVDIIPREGMADMLQQFYNSLTETCEKCAYVIPTFELEDTYPFPNIKLEIVHHFKNGSAKQVNADFSLSQQPTNYLAWTTTYLAETTPHVSHWVNLNNTRFYEPYYISSDDIPAFDERFLGYGLTRSSQFWESRLAGWNFSVLTPVFAIHWGFHKGSYKHGKLDKDKASFAEKVRENQTSHNRNIFWKVLKEMELKKEKGIF